MRDAGWTCCLAAWLVLTAVGGPAVAGPGPAPPAAGRHALLVACTRYPHLLPSRQLAGPANDVRLMQTLLVERFAFPPQQIVTLAEDVGGDAWQPSRANIEREFRRLAQQAREGDQVVILLSGHGSQQPQPDPPPPDDFEPDGLDEIFLPCDFQPWDGTAATPRNAIVDHELQAWLKAICRRKAAVWIIVDTCHAGTMIRGARGDVLRRVPPETILAPDARAEFLRRSVSPPAGAPAPRARFTPATPAEDAGHLVAIYASLADEATLETKLPPESPDQQPFGLLTYTLNVVLTRSTSPLTYRELVERIHRQYVQWGRSGPTPGVDGPDQDREVLGLRAWPQRAQILLDRKKRSGPWTINAGALHGLTAGTILAVSPPAGQGDPQTPLGYVRVCELDTFQSQVVPCPFGSLPRCDDLPVDGRCTPVYVEYGPQQMRVAVAGDPSRGTDDAAQSGQQRLRAALEALARRPGALITLSAQPDEADWRIVVEGGQIYLAPGSGWSEPGRTDRQPVGPSAAAARFGPVPLGADVENWLDERLRQIARARNLLKLAAAEELAPRQDSGLRIGVEVLRYRDDADPEGQPVRWGAEGITLCEGQQIAFRIDNGSPFPVDVSLLAVDSGFGMTPFFPTAGTAGDNRLPPGATIVTGRGRIGAQTTGLEHVVVIAVKARGPIVDFGCFAQATIPRQRGGVAGRGLYPAIDTPLGQLLQNAMFAAGTTRGASPQAAQTYTLRLLSWHTVPRLQSESAPPAAGAELPDVRREPGRAAESSSRP